MLQSLKSRLYDLIIRIRLFYHEVRHPSLQPSVFLYSYLEAAQRANIAKFISCSTSQLAQDLFVLAILGPKKNGYFVEFGACDGLLLSNTYMLEKHLEWGGIVAEPCRHWHDDLTSNRNCAVDFRCVHFQTGLSLYFKDIYDSESSPTLSSIQLDSNSPRQFHINDTPGYYVKSITLDDLLEENHAPKDIDYLSIDTEGGEYEILSAFSFEKWNVKIITVEHNYKYTIRNKIYRLLKSKGYIRVLKAASHFDDWYIHATVISSSQEQI